MCKHACVRERRRGTALDAVTVLPLQVVVAENQDSGTWVRRFAGIDGAGKSRAYTPEGVLYV